MKIIAHIESKYKEKFGIPRQSGIAENSVATIVFEPEYRCAEAVRGLSDFSHIWLLWEFSEAKRESWSPTVRPPRLGGNRRVGVFATRSPYRPNPIGLSSVRLISVDLTERGPVLTVAGADLLDGTPIYDIKPYLPYADSHPDAIGGFSDGVRDYALEVDIPTHLLSRVPEEDRDALYTILAHDPRPSYQEDPDRVYYLKYGNLEYSFVVKNGTLSVLDAQPFSLK